MRVVTFKAPETLVRAMDEYAKKYGLRRSEVIRTAVLLLLNNKYDKYAMMRQGKIRIRRVIVR